MFRFMKGVTAGATAAGSAFMLHQYQSARTAVSTAGQRQSRLAKARPSDYVHAHYAVEVYQDGGGQLLPGWQCLKTSGEPNSYHGAAYQQAEHKHIIIAHRGTQDLTDWGENFSAITRHLNEQEVSAWVFAKPVIGPIWSRVQLFVYGAFAGWLVGTDDVVSV